MADNYGIKVLVFENKYIIKYVVRAEFVFYDSVSNVKHWIQKLGTNKFEDFKLNNVLRYRIQMVCFRKII